MNNLTKAKFYFTGSGLLFCIFLATLLDPNFTEHSQQLLSLFK